MHPADHAGKEPKAKNDSYAAVETDGITCKEFLGLLADYALQFASGRDAAGISFLLRHHVARCAECARLIRRLARNLDENSASNLCDAADGDTLDRSMSGL